LAELQRLAGTQFDPRAVQAFLRVVKRRAPVLRRPEQEPQQPQADSVAQVAGRASVPAATEAEPRRSTAGPLRRPFGGRL
jgi:hypothetical protein